VKKAALIAAAVVLALAVGGVTYASARGLGPFARSHPGCPQAPCAPAERHCCGETAACQDTCKACPDFKDADKDGACDKIGDCSKHVGGACPGHDADGCGHRTGSRTDSSGCH